MISYEEFCENCKRLNERVERACVAAGRSLGSVKILPVTKNHPVEAPLYAARYGFLSVGENRVQESVDKKKAYSELLGEKPLAWDLIGHLQSNKTKLAVETFSRIQSVDSCNLITKLERLCGELGRSCLPILLQANAGEDPAKFGTKSFDDLRELAELAFSSPHLRVEGLMCVAPIDDDSLACAQRSFGRLREWRDRLVREFGKDLPELSMGMTHDLEVAILEGSTLIRVGTALFGAR